MSRSRRQSPTVVQDPPSYTVEGFCKAHHIARSYFYTLLRSGRGPDIYKVGRRTYISGDAAAEWRRRMEAQTNGSASHVH
jgi:hypothetical protein